MKEDVLKKGTEMLEEIHRLEETVEKARIVKEGIDGVRKIEIQINRDKYMKLRPSTLRHVMDLIIDLESSELLRTKREFDKL